MVHTVTFNQAMLAKDRVFAIRAGTYTSGDIKEASFNYGYISGDTFKPGGTVAGLAKLTFTSIITSFNKLDKVYPEIGLKVGDSFEWVVMGEYFVNDINIDRNRNTTELDLMDGMFKLNQPYISDLTYPAQIRDVIREICVKTGVELETDNLGFRAIQHHIQSKADKKDITFREVLSQAIQLLGFSAFFNRKGKLEIRGLTESNITITADNYFLHGLTKSELMYQIAGITCKKDKETLTVGLRTGRSLELENSFMIQNVLDDLYYDLKNIRYYPYSLDWQGHLKLDVGQWITLKTNRNETFKVPVLSQSFNFKGGLKSKISADSKAGNDTQYSYKGFLGKRIEQMSTEIEAEVQQQLEYKDKEFDEKINKAKSEINDGLEQSKADAEAYADNIKQQIDGQLAESDHQYQLAQQNQDRQIADILSKANANADLANAAKQLAERAQADLVQTRTNLTDLISQANTKANQFEQSIGNLRTDVTSQAQTILAQAQAQTALTNRVTTVETLADGTRSTVTELSKTVNKATGDIASVTSRTKTVEDTLSQTRTQYETLTQTVNTQTGQIESISRRTGTIETGLAGVREKFENLRIEDNLLLNSSFNENLDQWQGNGVTIVDGKARIIGEFNKTKSIYQSIKSQTANDDINQVYIASISVKVTNFAAGAKNPYLAIYIDGRKNDSANTWFGSTYLTTNRLETINNRGIVQFTTTFKVNVPRSQIGTLDFHIYTRDFTGEVEFEKVSLRRGNIDLGWQASPEDLRHEIATYVRNASENSAELSRQIQLVDGKAVDAKTYAQQTADAIKTRLESLEIYKNAEGDRAEQYLTASREETARQLTAERTAIATNYVAKSTYDENVRGTTLKLNDIKTTADTAKQNLATYQNTVDRKLTELTSTTQTLDGKINTASAKITQNANEISKRLTSTQVDKAITDKGYQTKSDVDNNITGRGYITNSALQPYALSTTVQNLVQETAGSFERQITETRGLIPTEVNQNLFDVVFNDLRATGGASFVQSDDGWIEVTIKNRWSGFHWYYSDDINPSKKQYVVSYDAYLVDTVAETARLESDFGSPDQLTLINKTPKRYTVVLNRPVNIFNYINFVCDSSETGKKFRIRNIKLEEGIVATPYIAPFPTTVLFNAVKDTVDAHKQLIGNGDSISQAIQSANKFERYISSGGDIYRVIETANGLVTEVTGEGGLKTQVSTLAGSYAIKNLTSNGQILNQINLLANGTNRIDGRLTHITGQTLIDNGVIKNAMIGNLDAGKINTGTLNAARIAANSITGNHMVFDQAFVNKMTANEALFKQLFAQSAFITSVQAVTMSASKIAGGILSALNGATEFNLQTGQISLKTDGASIQRIADGYPTHFLRFVNDATSYHSTTVLGASKTNTSPNDPTFAGMRIFNSKTKNSIVDLNAYSITFQQYPLATKGFYMDVANQELRPIDSTAQSKVSAKDIYIDSRSLATILDNIFDNFKNLNNNGNYTRNFYSTWR